MANERQPPDVVLESTELIGGLADIDDDPDSPDANWMIATGNNVDTDARTSFPTPTGNPTIGADLQEFKAQVRQYDGTQTGVPTAHIELWEDGALVRAGSDVDIASDVSQIITFTWNANELSNVDGSLVECKFVGSKTGGSPSKRNTVDLGAVEWNVTYDEGVSAPWLAGYSYRKKIPITGQSGAGADYQVKLEVHSDSGSDSNGVVYFANHSQNFPDDIRFTDDDGQTELDHWLEEFDIENNKAIFWIEVKDDLGSNQDFYIYYGKLSDSSASDGDATFSLFDDFEAAALDVGKWDLVQGAVNLEKDLVGGGFIEQHIKPVATYFSGTYSRTYFCYLTRNKKVNIQYYDHDFDVLSSPVTLYTYGSVNAHGAPSLLVLPSGKIIVFYALHESALYCRKSTNVEDISAWDGAVTIEATGTTYPQPMLLSNGDLWVFYRYAVSGTHRACCYKVSGDDGDTWGGRVTLVDWGNDYTIYYMAARGGATIHVSWSVLKNSTGAHQNVYYIYSPDNGSTWKTRADVTKAPPIDATEADLVYDTPGTDITIVYDMKLDGSNSPFIAIIDDYESDPCDARFAFYDSGWETHFICNIKKHSGGDPGGICIDDNDVYTIYAGVPDAGISEIQKWMSPDYGDNWNFSESITDESNHGNYRPQIVKNYNSALKLLWNGYRHWTIYTDYDTFLLSHPDVMNKRLELKSTTVTPAIIYSQDSFASPKVFASRAISSLPSVHATVFCGADLPNATVERASQWYTSTIDNRLSFRTYRNGTVESTLDFFPPGDDVISWHRYRTIWGGLNDAKAYIEDTLKAAHTNYVTNSNQKVWLQEASGGNVGVWLVDWVFIRKYNDPEPIVGTAGGEEENPISTYYHGWIIQPEGELALCDVGSNPLRTSKGGTTYGIELVETNDPNASRVRIKTPAGIKAIRKYT